MRCGIVILTLALATDAHGQAPRAVEFNRDIRPILSDACFNCHGPDKSKRKGGLHFDTEESARADLGGYFAIVPGKPRESMLIQRVTSNDPAKRMPPPSSGPALSKDKIGLLQQWIAQGAKWQKHWSFIPPERPPLPEVQLKNWPRNPIDYFVLARLEKEGFKPAPEADPITLLRRVSFDLTGLPPTPAEVDAFLEDCFAAKGLKPDPDQVLSTQYAALGPVPDAVWNKHVDRLLESPRYGERMAQRWLDAARYADTNGYQTDGPRTMWRWRDWVIEAYNANMPFDRFTVEQIAGDMLPKPTLEQRIATGFNRNHRGNSEGGVIPEEYAVEYVVDRVDTTATVWLGLTAGCAKCHDHKYDPVSQREFYQLFAYFNNVPERGKAIKYGNSPPYIKTPTRVQQVKLKMLETDVKLAAAEWSKLQPELAEAQTKWEAVLDSGRPIDWTLTRGLKAHFSLDAMPANGAPMSTHGAVELVPGKIAQAMAFDGSYLDAGDVGNFGFFDKFTVAAWIHPHDGGAIVSRMVDTDRADGYSLVLEDGKLHVNLVKRWLDDAIRVETESRPAPNRWHHVTFSYDGSRVADGIKIYLNGALQKLKVNLDDLNQSFNNKEPFRIGAGGASRFHGVIDDVRVYDRVLSAAEVMLVATTESIAEIAATPPGQRTLGQRQKSRTYFIEEQAPQIFRAPYLRLRKAREDLAAFDESIPTTMVMVEMPTPRPTHVLLRGEYDKPGKRVTPGIPAMFGPFPKELPNNRLGFGQWLVRRDNPLTARVAVNRHWQMLLGAGLVKSTEDFGAQGEWPTHPDLLDWLAVEFMEPTVGGLRLSETGQPPVAGRSDGVAKPQAAQWDVKHLLKTIVTSATYRQSSRAAKDLQQRDPDNRLLARGPRFRLPAEMIRDQALHVSGLLVEKLGGPSVKPYSPPGLIKELHGTDEDEQDHGDKLYRRSLYTYWKRTVAPPALMTFDAANRETCVVRETRTNTPLQALNLLNDVTYVEAARVMAERVLKAGVNADDRLALAFRLTASRPPERHELAILRAGLDQHLRHYRQDREAALKLVSRGEHPRDQKLDVAELAAYAALCNTLLNLDETITKE